MNQILPFDKEFLDTYRVLQHKTSGSYYCMTQEAYNILIEEHKVSHVSKCPDEIIRCYPVDTETRTVANTFVSFYVRDLIGGIVLRHPFNFADIRFIETW